MHESEAHRYALDVVHGTQPASKYTIKACQRYLTDLDTAEERGLEFRPRRRRLTLHFFSGRSVTPWANGMASRSIHFHGNSLSCGIFTGGSVKTVQEDSTMRISLWLARMARRHLWRVVRSLLFSLIRKKLPRFILQQRKRIRLKSDSTKRKGWFRFRRRSENT